MFPVEKYIEVNNIREKKEIDKFLYVAYFLYKNGRCVFSVEEINDILKSNGIFISNISRLKRIIKKSKLFKIAEKENYTLTSEAIKRLGKDNIIFENNNVEAVSNEILDTTIFMGHTGYLDKLIMQINKCYEVNCFDACATLIRRVIEILLIKSYEANNIESQIKENDGSYYLLDKICKNAKTNSTLNLSRIKNKLDDFRNLGNFAAHRIEYKKTKKDIDDLKINLRALLEELLYKANFVK